METIKFSKREKVKFTDLVIGDRFTIGDKTGFIYEWEKNNVSRCVADGSAMYFDTAGDVFKIINSEEDQVVKELELKDLNFDYDNKMSEAKKMQDQIFNFVDPDLIFTSSITEYEFSMMGKNSEGLRSFFNQMISAGGVVQYQNGLEVLNEWVRVKKGKVAVCISYIV